MAAFLVIPVYLMAKISVSVPGEVFTQHPSLLIHDVTLKHWEQIWTAGTLWPSLRKSLTVATATALTALCLSAPAAYVIARMPRAWKYTTLLTLFFTRMFPEVGIALPIAIRFIEWGLFDTDLGLTLAHLVRTLPITAWILVGSFEAIPKEVEEAAGVDGAGHGGTLLRVILPLALPGLSVAAIFAWLLSWEEFIFAIYLSLANKTLPLQVYYYVYQGNWFLTATYTTIITIPVLILTYALQRYLKAGYLAGAIK
ncbi:MAG: carbohydrate ABC transporter permease [Candidatus Methylomirabilales bacterium]